MSPAFSPIVVLSALSGVVSLWLAGRVLRVRHRPGALAFAGVLAGGALWTLSAAVALTVTDPGTRAALELPIWTGRMLMPVAWVLFAFAYAGRDEMVSPLVVALLALPEAVALALLATNESHHLFWSNYHIVGDTLAVAQYTPGVAFVFTVVYAYALIGGGSVLLLGTALAARHGFDDQVLGLLVGAAVPCVTNVLWLFDRSPVPGVDLTPIALSVTGVCFAYALFRTEVFVMTPGTRRVGLRAALRELDEAFVILDDDGHVVEVNDAALALFGVSETEAHRTHVDDLLDPVSVALEPGNQRVDLETARGMGVFELVVSEVTDERGRTRGYNLVFHDVTEREQRKQRLSVLNRLLRHNLRNAVNVIDGAIVTIPEADPAEKDALMETASRRSADLVDLADRARDIQRVVETRAEHTREVELDGFVDGVVDDVRDSFPDREYRCSIPSGLATEADVVVLELVVRNAIENAAEHNSPGGLVEVSASTWADGRWIDLAVVDDGPGIPDHERVAIYAQAESELQHASALGLWLIRWGVTTLGGDVSVADNDEGGTTIHLHLPRAASDESVVGAAPET